MRIISVLLDLMCSNSDSFPSLGSIFSTQVRFRCAWEYNAGHIQAPIPVPPLLSQLSSNYGTPRLRFRSLLFYSSASLRSEFEAETGYEREGF